MSFNLSRRFCSNHLANHKNKNGSITEKHQLMPWAYSLLALLTSDTFSPQSRCFNLRRGTRIPLRSNCMLPSIDPSWWLSALHPTLWVCRETEGRSPCWRSKVDLWNGTLAPQVGAGGPQIQQHPHRRWSLQFGQEGQPVDAVYGLPG